MDKSKSMWRSMRSMLQVQPKSHGERVTHHHQKIFDVRPRENCAKRRLHFAGNKTPAYFISALIITILLLAGPANGFSLNFFLDNSSPTVGQFITFTAEIEIPSGEKLPIEELTLTLSGPQTVSCRFSPDGTILSSCPGIKITPSQKTNFGYGYNYGYYGYGYSWGYGYGYNSGKLVYSIKLDTTNYQQGSYETEIEIKIRNNEFSQKGPDFTINPVQSFSGGCSTEWQCSDWSSCVDGRQSRTCEKIKSQCNAGWRPEEIRTCTVSPLTELLNSNSNQNQNTADEPDQNATDKTQDSTSFITGAVTGVFGYLNSKNGLVIIIVMISVVIIIGATIKIRARRRARKIINLPEKFY